MDKHIYDLPYMNISPLMLFKCLADETRLTSLLLIENETELCVCELTAALAVVQPKVSRHLAQLRECGLLLDRREGQWVYYRINPALPDWIRNIISSAKDANSETLSLPLGKLAEMGNRPQRKESCC